MPKRVPKSIEIVCFYRENDKTLNIVFRFCNVNRTYGHMTNFS